MEVGREFESDKAAGVVASRVEQKQLILIGDRPADGQEVVVARGAAAVLVKRVVDG